jgi:cytochrome P450
MPFGGGRCRCIGAGLAQLERSLVTSTILMACDLVPANSRPAKPQRRGITLGPDQVKLSLTRRRAAEPVMV